MYFDELALSDGVLDALWDMHFDTCTPVQEKTIPVILDGHDVISCAQTGTGKTAAYILPLLTNLEYDNHDADKLNAIIMAPTRELAQQIDQQMEGFSFYVPFSSVAIYGGKDNDAWGNQTTGLQRGADIVIATPGRLLSLINIYDVDFSGVKYFILDEADRMLDMGFSEDIIKISKLLPPTCQTIMFSATMPDKIEELAKEEGAEMMIVAAKTEEDIAGFDSYEDKQMFLEELGLEESGVNRLIKKAYALLNLQTFITAGEMEVKAWTFRKGWKAPQCAGVIHTDFEKGFIRAEVIKYDDYIKYGSEAAVREAGKMGVEGKEYVVQDGDIMHFRFNV